MFPIIIRRPRQSYASLLRCRQRCICSTKLFLSPDKKPPTAATTNTITSTTTTTQQVADDAVTVDETVDKVSDVDTPVFNKIQPRAIFPWISSSDPLSRLIRPAKPTLAKETPNNIQQDDTLEEDNNTRLLREYYDSDYFIKGGLLGPGWPSPMTSYFRGALWGTSMSLLGVPWWKVIIPWSRNDWIFNMESAFCNAFANGVNGMILDTYILQEDENDDKNDIRTDKNEETFDVDIDVTLDPVPLLEREVIQDKNSIQTFSKEEEESSMLEENLRQLYKNAKEHSHPTKVNIVLKTIPQYAQIESMFPVFGLSRSLVQDHPNLRHTYRNQLKRLRDKNKEALLAGKSQLNPIEVGTFLLKALMEVMDRSAKLSDDKKAATTIVAQVSVHCKEVFCVKDVESGEIIQGYIDGQPRDVTHLVRFEMIVKEELRDVDTWNDFFGESDIELGRWQITDWDDLQDGNIFFT